MIYSKLAWPLSPEPYCH